MLSYLSVQVYAACGDSSSGSIRVIQADQTVEVLYESPADYPGISGMWSIPPWPGADFHSLLVLSFASGSRAMATGVLCVLMSVLQTWFLCVFVHDMPDVSFPKPLSVHTCASHNVCSSKRGVFAYMCFPMPSLHSPNMDYVSKTVSYACCHFFQRGS